MHNKNILKQIDNDKYIKTIQCIHKVNYKIYEIKIISKFIYKLFSTSLLQSEKNDLVSNNIILKIMLV